MKGKTGRGERNRNRTGTETEQGTETEYGDKAKYGIKKERTVKASNRRTVNLENIRNNMALIRKHVPASAELFAVVKADAYGHGSVETARAALAGGADRLAVARVDEGTVLRQHGIDVPILVLGAATREDAEEGVAMGLTQTVCDPDMVRFCGEAAERQGRTAEVHLKIDTGMGRIGVRTREERDAVLNALRESAHLRLTGAFTHFADADGDEDGMAYTRLQFRRFTRTEEQTVLLPYLQAAAIAAAQQAEPELIYADAGDDTACMWVIADG